MEQRAIGSLTVSVVGLGCNQLGTAACDETTARRVVAEAVDAGITFFDTADEYGGSYGDTTDPGGWGRSEEILGQALAGRRDAVVLATKVGARHHGAPDGRGGASARWIATGVEESLRRLQTDHIDLYQLHLPDATVPVEETLAALDALVRAGKVREIGVCNFSGDALVSLVESARSMGIAPLVSEQSALSLLSRRAVDDVLPHCAAYGMAFVPYHPLASGMLTGKYHRGEDAAVGTRFAEQLDDATRSRLMSERTFARVDALNRYAADHGRTLLELAFGWLLGHDVVSTVIAGAARPGQPAANAAAAGWTMTADEVAEATRVVEAAG
jgi:aryl-alcohol dehydrogenase-like predicted oxidoreductase